MAISWNRLPLEMKQSIVSKMGVRSRVNLSMCSKSENQLVRSTKYGNIEYISLEGNKFIIEFGGSGLPWRQDGQRVTVEPGNDGGSNVSVNRSSYKGKEKYSTKSDWKETIWNIMNLIGSKITADILDLCPDIGFEESFNWLRNNIHIKPQLVELTLHKNDYYDKSMFDWPSNTKFLLRVSPNKFSKIERFITYDNIVTLGFFGWNGEYAGVMTDEKLMKLKNANLLVLIYSNVTLNGFDWWIRKWLTQKDDKESYNFRIVFHEGNNDFSLENIKNRLSDVCGKTEKYFNFSAWWEIEIKKNGKVGGIISLRNDEVSFSSIETKPDKSKQVKRKKKV